MDRISLKRQKRDPVKLNLSKCIICEKDSNQQLSSTDQRRKQILEAAELRQDDVTKRLKDVDVEQIKYHVDNAATKPTHLRRLLNDYS